MDVIKYNELSQEFFEQIPRGAFMTVRDDEHLNTMTIGWGSIGFIWNKPIFTALVRYSRYTYELMKNNKEFTISVPLNGQLKKELGICGSKSGRDMNKFDELGLTPAYHNLSTPIIEECDLHFECKLVYKQAMEPANVDMNIEDGYYTNHDYHVMFYGEIIHTLKK